MTESTPEPTLADVLAAVNEQAASLAALTAAMQQGFSHAMTEIGGVKADIRAQGQALVAMSSKVAFIEANQNVLMDKQAELRGAIRTSFDAVARDMKQVQEGIAGVKSDTAFVERWNQDMHEALVRHIADPHAHPDAA